jgi:hypothetical protein
VGAAARRTPGNKQISGLSLRFPAAFPGDPRRDRRRTKKRHQKPLKCEQQPADGCPVIVEMMPFKKLLLLVCPLLLLHSAAFGSPCASTAFSSYLEASFACTIDNLLFSDFSLDNNLGGAETAAASAMLVTSQDSGLTLESRFSYGEGGWRNLTFGFLVSAPVNIAASMITIEPSGLRGAARLTLVQSHCLNGAFQPDGACSSGSMVTTSAETTEAGLQLTETAIYPSAVTSVDIIQTVSLWGARGDARPLSLVSNSFVMEGPPILAPEPGASFLVGTGLLLVAGALRRLHRR